MAAMKETIGEKIFRLSNIAILGIFGFLMLVPLLKVVSTSLSSPFAVDSGQVFLWPVDFTLASWVKIVEREALWRSFGLNVLVTVMGTAMCLLMTALMAYPMSKREFAPARFLAVMVVITMVFRYPIIPYFLAVREFGLYDNFWVLIIPHLITAYNLIIMRTFFRELPQELEEAAQMEGCGYFRMLFLLVLPISKAVLATLGIFYAVMLWNQFMHPLMFIDNQNLYPLQLRLREYMVSTESTLTSGFEGQIPYSSATLKAATVIFATAPILAVYPFLQKHFVKGATLGSVK
ncbi:putative aldouronate transport system permease protein [Paenibacillus sp. UNCCL117]|uniref:carbohydrate ABC transporter permease n=1 Tax=unclassified Paenibacillus TaxID=185978 RepID=UPI00088AF15B|nr:putative aldouronate transport system permease protein [Paenibacillus sp. cl123]SFW57245.1 putative aldouronate transport system permease protein [Paenibacillus sp. UNCCL117]